MKKYLITMIFVTILFTLLSCNGHFRFLVDPIPSHPVIIQPMSPGAGNIWIGGEWFWNGSNYAWRDGYWARPLDGNRWVPGTWEKRNKGSYWKPGRWRK
ncbi:MAG TPA: hypothetical protein VIL78_15595 [Hanamia sp.]